MSVLIVGAGLAGLTCARHLGRQNIDVVVLEASDGVGGRVRSDRLDGFVLDRGFQVLFDAYPAVRRNVDLPALDLRAFDPGAIICLPGGRTVLTDPIRDRNARDVAEALRSAAISFGDKVRTLRLSVSARDTSGDQSTEPDDQSTQSYLRTLGFEEESIDRFFRPFYGGIFLDRTLTTSAAAFRFYFAMLSSGSATLPARGIGEITRQLSATLDAQQAIRLNAPVTELLRENDRVTGVRTGDGQELRADAVVLATEAPTARRLVGEVLDIPDGSLPATAVYFASTLPLVKGRKLILNAAPEALVNNAQVLSNVQPGYAAPGRHLLSATVLGEQTMSDAELAVAVVRDLRRMFKGNVRAQAALDTHYPLRVYRIPYAQFPQPPGIYSRLPKNTTPSAGLFVAGEWTEASSINGAMVSGERCAAAVGRWMRDNVTM